MSTRKYVHVRETCRLCGSAQLQMAVKMREVPILSANIESNAADTVETAPVDLYLCSDCGNLQMNHVVDPTILYRNYLYRTSVSHGLVEHYEALAASLIGNLAPPENGFVLEIGSNDGSLLRNFGNAGYRVLGVDPARRIAEEATRAGIPTLPEMFDSGLSDGIRKEHGPADIILANNVIANIDELDDMFEGIRRLLAPGGSFVMETQNGGDVIRHRLIDTIYHEHLSYFLSKPLVRFFEKHGMTVYDIEPISTKGGSIRVYASLHGSGRRIESSVDKAFEADETDGLNSISTYRLFTSEKDKLVGEVRETVRRLADDNGMIAGYGASVGTGTLISEFDIADRLSYIVDDAPAKRVLTNSGREFEIVGRERLLNDPPSCVIIFAWRYADRIIQNNWEYVQAGGRFVVPLPDVRVVGADALEAAG